MPWRKLGVLDGFGCGKILLAAAIFEGLMKAIIDDKDPLTMAIRRMISSILT